MEIIPFGYASLGHRRNAEMNFTQIKYFLAVAESLNFTNAAEACAVSQPALSKAIQNLEESLGADLFERNAQRVELTNFGNTMRVHFERIDENRRKALNAAKLAAKATIQHLNVGVMCTIGPRQFGRFLASFVNDHPKVEVTLHDVIPAVIPDLLLSGSLDCVFCARSAKHDQRFLALDLYSESMVVAFAAGHPFSDLSEVPLEKIANEPYLDRLHCEFRDDFLNFTKGSGLELNVVLGSEREDWILEMLSEGAGVSVIPENSIVLDRVEHRPISDLPHLRNLELVMMENATTSPGLVAFREAAMTFEWR